MTACGSTLAEVRIGRSVIRASSKSPERQGPSLLLEGESIVTTARMANLALLHSRDYDSEASLTAFDLLEYEGTGVPRQNSLDRKFLLIVILHRVKDGIEFNAHLEEAGGLVFKHACKLAHEGIVAKRNDLLDESGKSRRWSQIAPP